MASAPEDPNDPDPIVPPEAPDQPENPLLKHYGWTPMWVENGNAVIVFVGDPGDGKSWGSLRWCESVDPTFNIDRVAWDIVEFLELVMDDSIGQGQAIVLEEGSVEASAYDWHSVSNDVFRKVLDTWRHQNRMAVINLPSFKVLDKGARRRTDAIVEMMEAKPWKDYSQAKFKEVNYNNIDDHFSTPFPVLQGQRHKYIRFRPPSDDLREAYEERKQAYTGELNEELLEKLLSEADDTDAGGITPEEIVETILEEDRAEEYIKEYQGRRYIADGLIEVDFNVGGRKSKTAKQMLERELGLD